ncbi:MAG: hypothetical protein U0326_07175 [Polyangiales bacterium]
MAFEQLAHDRGLAFVDLVPDAFGAADVAVAKNGPAGDEAVRGLLLQPHAHAVRDQLSLVRGSCGEHVDHEGAGAVDLHHATGRPLHHRDTVLAEGVDEEGEPHRVTSQAVQVADHHESEGRRLTTRVGLEGEDPFAEDPLSAGDPCVAVHAGHGVPVGLAPEPRAGFLRVERRLLLVSADPEIERRAAHRRVPVDATCAGARVASSSLCSDPRSIWSAATHARSCAIASSTEGVGSACASRSSVRRTVSPSAAGISTRAGGVVADLRWPGAV